MNVPATDDGLDALLEIVPDDDHARTFLLQDGNLAVPCSRYGRDTTDCAEVAIVASRIMAAVQGEPMTYHGLDSDMGLVVNDSDDIAYLIVSYGPCELGIDPADYLYDDTIAEARERIAEEEN